MSKDLPEIIINSEQEGIEVGPGSTFDYHLELFDSTGTKIKNYSAVDDTTKAILTVTVTKKEEKFPDENKWITYKFSHLEGLEKDENGRLKVSSKIKETVLWKINGTYGKLIESRGQEIIGVERNDGLKETNIKYKIQADSNPHSNVRVDVYKEGSPNDYKKITGKELKIRLVWNKRAQVDLEADGLVVFVSPHTNKGFEIKTWHVVAGVSGIILLLGLVFYRRIFNWIKSKKKKQRSREDEVLGDLDNF